MRSAALAVARTGAVRVSRGYTWAEAGFPVTQPSALFRQASVSKLFTSAAAQALHDDNVLGSRYSRGGLATYYVLFFLHLETRRVTLAGITQHPNEKWMVQMASNAVDVVDGALLLRRRCLSASADRGF